MRLVCPKCGSDENLVSVETAQVDFRATFTAEGPTYVGYDAFHGGGPCFQDCIWCRGCDLEYTLAQLVPG